MKKLAVPYLDSIVENLSLLEEVKQQVTAKDVEVLNSQEPHQLPKALRAQMIYYISVIAEGANNIIGTPNKEALAPGWFTLDETVICKRLISLRNKMLHGYLSSADDRIFWAGINGADFQMFMDAISRLAQQHL
ncbi:MAG: hypothetical protein HC771_20200 [Synechococcales cyanobacterium CRU_2_2]|nr:hypothetical protein [Synechococcales cyanobacterium CRU_2_2]